MVFFAVWGKTQRRSCSKRTVIKTRVLKPTNRQADFALTTFLEVQTGAHGNQNAKKAYKSRSRRHQERF